MLPTSGFYPGVFFQKTISDIFRYFFLNRFSFQKTLKNKGFSTFLYAPLAAVKLGMGFLQKYS